MLKKFIKELREFWKKNDVPNITETNAKFLKDLIKIWKYKNALEIWTANGLSAIELTSELIKNSWKLTTIEFSTPSFLQAKKNAEKIWLEKNINFLNWNALFIIPELKEKYDFVFIDWMKRRSVDFLDLVRDKVEKNWLIIIDDVIKFKDKMKGLEEFLQKNNIDYNILPIDVDDWVMMIIKQKEKLYFRWEKDYSKEQVKDNVKK